MTELDPKGLAAAVDAYNAVVFTTDEDHTARIVAAYLEAAPSPSPAPGMVEQNAETHLSNLLARIHRDGGHYEAEHGTDKACEDADRIIAELYAATPANPAQGVSEELIGKAIVEAINALRMEHSGRAYDILHEALTAAIGAGGQAVAISRDKLGQVVREAWVRWAKTQPDPKPSWLVPYDQLSEPDKEADRQIGETVYALAHPAPSGQAVAAFGEGKLVVTPGTVDGKPAVFIAPAKMPGEVGTSAKRENIPSYSLIAGEWYMTFPTDEQARLVADALCNALAHPVQPGWRDMESAPKDGTEILCWTAYDEQDVVWWDGGNWCAGKDADGGRAYYPGVRLWQPLPAAPQPKGE